MVSNVSADILSDNYGGDRARGPHPLMQMGPVHFQAPPCLGPPTRLYSQGTALNHMGPPLIPIPPFASLHQCPRSPTSFADVLFAPLQHEVDRVQPHPGLKHLFFYKVHAGGGGVLEQCILTKFPFRTPLRVQVDKFYALGSGGG